MKMHTLKKRTYLTKDGKATEDPAKGVKLYGPAGHEVPEEEARAVGLLKKRAQSKAKKGPEEDK